MTTRLACGLDLAHRVGALSSAICLGVRAPGAPPRLIGSGVLLSIGDRRQVLTADHVAEELLSVTSVTGSPIVTWEPNGGSGFSLPREAAFRATVTARCASLDAALLDPPFELATANTGQPAVYDLLADVAVLSQYQDQFKSSSGADLPFVLAGFPNVGKFYAPTADPGLGLVGVSCMMFGPEISAWRTADLATTRMLKQLAPQISMRSEIPPEADPEFMKAVTHAREPALLGALWKAAKARDDAALGSLSGAPLFWCVERGDDPALVLAGIAKEAHWEIDSDRTGRFTLIASSAMDILAMAGSVT